MIVILFLVAHWYLSLFAQSFFHHRYAAHRMFTMSRFWEKFWYWFSFITQGSSFLSPYAYGILHRLHHAHADTEKDPHSPNFDSSLWSMMWRTQNIYSKIRKGTHKVDSKYKQQLPDWKWFERVFGSRFFRFMWVLVYVGIYWMWAPSWWFFLLIPLHIFIGPIHGAIVNWYAHKYGQTRYELDNTSRNLLPVDVIMMGESYHNNHHRFPNRPNFGVKWYEFDPVYPFIRLFNWMGIIQLRSKTKQKAA